MNYDYEILRTPEADAMNQLILQATVTLNEQEQQHFLALLSKAWNEGFDALRDEYEKQRRDPSYPLRRDDPYKALMER